MHLHAHVRACTHTHIPITYKSPILSKFFFFCYLSYAMCTFIYVFISFWWISSPLILYFLVRNKMRVFVLAKSATVDFGESSNINFNIYIYEKINKPFNSNKLLFPIILLNINSILWLSPHMLHLNVGEYKRLTFLLNISFFF